MRRTPPSPRPSPYTRAKLLQSLGAKCTCSLSVPSNACSRWSNDHAPTSCRASGQPPLSTTGSPRAKKPGTSSLSHSRRGSGTVRAANGFTGIDGHRAASGAARCALRFTGSCVGSGTVRLTLDCSCVRSGSIRWGRYLTFPRGPSHRRTPSTTCTTRNTRTKGLDAPAHPRTRVGGVTKLLYRYLKPNPGEKTPRRARNGQYMQELGAPMQLETCVALQCIIYRFPTAQLHTIRGWQTPSTAPCPPRSPG